MWYSTGMAIVFLVAILFERRFLKGFFGVGWGFCIGIVLFFILKLIVGYNYNFFLMLSVDLLVIIMLSLVSHALVLWSQSRRQKDLAAKK